MFLGQHQLTLENNRFLLTPVSFRALLADGAYITRGFEQNLIVMSEKVFQEIYKRVVGLNLADPLARLLLRLILGNASKLEMDEIGRVFVPENLAAFAGLEKDIILVGQGDYFEIWSPTHWEKQSAELLNTDTNTERFAQLDLASH